MNGYTINGIMKNKYNIDLKDLSLKTSTCLHLNLATILNDILSNNTGYTKQKRACSLKMKTV